MGEPNSWRPLKNFIPEHQHYDAYTLLRACNKMSNTKERAIQEAKANLIPYALKGVISVVFNLTPSAVHDKMDKKWEKEFSRVRYKIIALNPTSGKPPLGSQVIWRDNGKPKTVGIYEGSQVFPDECCKCQEAAERYEVLELRRYKYSVNVRVDERDKVKAEKLWNALQWDRFWYPVPLCDEHSIRDAVYFKSKPDLIRADIKLAFENQEYGKKFALNNDLKGISEKKLSLKFW